ncbi:MAG: glycerate kinase, partial [Rhodobacteraceae bacterium]|nr:glycerate kinase [Paracoccaceae bacterium]
MADTDLLHDMFQAALEAADPMAVIPGFLPERPKGRVIVVGAGKASARMAQAVEAVWPGCEGLVIVPHGATLPTQSIELVEGSHPVPDAAGEAAGRRILDMLGGLGPDDLALCLISGGGSSLMAVPGPGLTLADKQAVNKALLASGAAISEMNVVRKHLSATKGGRLALTAHPAQVVTLTISDVPGDDPSIIASGPTVPDPSTLSEAREIVARYDMDLPQAALDLLNDPAAESPEPSHPVFATAKTHIVAAPQASLVAAAVVAENASVRPLILGDAIEGEAREAGIVMAGITRQVLNHGQPAPAPVTLISGGETTVTIKKSGGRGGRNTEFLLAFAIATWDISGFCAIACDTDGRDGSEHNAGAIWHPEM